MDDHYELHREEKTPLLNQESFYIRQQWGKAIKIFSGTLLVAATIGFVLSAPFSSSSSRSAGVQVRAAAPAPAVEDTALQVTVEQGVLQGKRSTSRDGREYLEFRGVPYAKPPLGDLRFKSPVAPDAWEGTRDASESKPVCIQKRSRNPEPHGSEDCLYLNVFTPKTNLTTSNSNSGGRRRNRGRDLLPVIFYIHGGGGGAEGDGSRYGGEYYMDEDVVLVTIDYRLGVLGALNLNITDASGNQGLKDQVMGLQWVQTNIQAFGGDKSRVTLVGNSAGAHQVSTHMVSPMSRPLFHGAVSQSGTTITPGYMSGDPVQDGVDLGQKLNCSVAEGDMAALLDCFRNKTAFELVMQSIHLRHWFTFTYSVDTAAADGDQFLPEAPLTRMLAGNMNRIPYMIGATSAEGLPQALQVLLQPERNSAYNAVPWTDNNVVIQDLQLQLSTTPEKAGDIAEQARQFYFGNQTQTTMISNETIQTLSNMLSDRLFDHPMYVTALQQFAVNNNTTSANGNAGRRNGGGGRRRGQSPPGVYMYILSHKIQVSRCQDDRFQVDTVWGIEDFGVCHADELQFFFPNGGAGGIYPAIDADHEYAPFSRSIVKLWATFAANGVPVGTTSNVTWTPIDGTKPFHALELNEDPQMVEYFPDRMAFWDQFNYTDLFR